MRLGKTRITEMNIRPYRYKGDAAWLCEVSLAASDSLVTQRNHAIQRDGTNEINIMEEHMR
jgi:hypothetical protein